MDTRSTETEARTLSENAEEQHLRLDALSSAGPLLLNQGQLLDFLCEPKSYAISDPVERIDAADSILFLAGDHCFKLRRPMPLEQNSNPNLEQRHELALEEIKLGKSFAPDLYLGLVPVRVRDSQFYIDHTSFEDGSGALKLGHRRNSDLIAEWLIMMRRYDVSKSLSKMVEIYRPNFTECNQLADLVSASSASNTESHAVDGQLWHTHLTQMLERFAPAIRQINDKSRQQTLHACLSRARYRLSNLINYLDDRGKKDGLCEIHGNVGLDNIVQTPKGLRLVNPAVRQQGGDVQAWIGDPTFDLASLIDELWARGLNRQANWVFSHACNSRLDSQELDGLQAMDLYLFVCAFEKARQLSKAQRTSATAQSVGKLPPLLKGYVQTARDSLVQDEAKLLVVGGSTQANRSHLARMIAPIIGRMPGAIYMSAYQEMLALYDVHHEADLPQSAHRRSVWRLVYRRLATKAQLALDSGYSVILSGAFDTPVSRKNLTLLQQKIGKTIPLQAFHLFDPMADMKEAENGEKIQPFFQDLEYRSRQISGDTEFTSQQAPEGTPILGSEGDCLDWTNWIELDASRSVSALVDQVLGYINPLWVPSAQGTLH